MARRSFSFQSLFSPTLKIGMVTAFSFFSVTSVFAQHKYEFPGMPVPSLDMAHYSDRYPYSGAIARVLASSFATIGVKVKTRPVDLNVFVSTILLNRGIRDMAVGYVVGSSDHYSPNYYLNALNGSESMQNPTRYSSKEFDAVAKEQAAESDPKKRMELVNRAQEIQARDRPSWSLFTRGLTYIYNKQRWPDMKKIEPLGPQIGLVQFLDATPADPKHTTFIQGWPGDVSTWNPFAEGAPGYQARHRYVYDSFVKQTYGGEVIPWAAESWKWVTPTRINVVLRSGMTFHDGRPVTVDDAVFSFNYWIKWKPPLWAGIVSNQKSATKIDENTFQIELYKPDTDFVSVSLGWCIILPKHIWENIPEKVNVSNPWDWDPVASNQVIGSGPYEFVSWRRDQETNFKTNKKHFHAAKMDGMRIVQITTADSMAAALESGQIDWATSPLSANTQKGLAERNVHLAAVVEKGIDIGVLWLNNEKAPFNDPVFRQALQLATPYARIREVGWQGFSEIPGTGPLPANAPWYDQTLAGPEFNIQKAKEILLGAGYTISDGVLYYPKK